jgi:hypothetical protein
MKRLITIAAIMISFPSFGQESSKAVNTADFNRLSFGINISPDYCFRTLKNNDGSSTSAMIIAERNKHELFKIGYTAGLNVCYNISRKAAIGLGVQYSNKGFKFSESGSDLTFGDMNDPRYGFIYATATGIPDKIITNYNYHYIDIPLTAVFTFGQKRIQFVTRVGIAANILLSSNEITILKYPDGSKKRQTQDQLYDYRKLDISPTASIGIAYKISNKICMKIEPTFRYGLIKIIDSPVTGYLWNGGLNISCYYSLR